MDIQSIELINTRINNCEQFLKLPGIELAHAYDALMRIADANILWYILTKGDNDV